MTTLIRRSVAAWTASEAWLTRHPWAMVGGLAAFTVLFAGYAVYDYRIGNTGMAAMATLCGGLSAGGAGFETVRIRLRGDIAAGQGGGR